VKSLPSGSTIDRQRFHRHCCKPLSKYPPAALIQRVATATVHHLLEQLPHRLDLSHQLLEFRQFPARQFLPALRRRSRIPKTKEQFADFIQREPSLPCPLDHRQPVKYSGVVAPLPTDSLRRNKNSNLLVIANRRRLKSNLSRHLGNSQLWHPCILDQDPLEPIENRQPATGNCFSFILLGYFAGTTCTVPQNSQHFTNIPLALKLTLSRKVLVAAERQARRR